jgi:lon-related putative ATP-dependent protease
MFFKRLTKDKSGRLPAQPVGEAGLTGPSIADQPKGSSAFALPAADLRRTVEAKSLGFKTTADLKPAPGLIGQDRAFKAIELGLSMKARDFNIFVVGPPSSGKSTAVRAYLTRAAELAAPPSDWVYVNNYEDSRRPRALKLPAGRGRKLAQGVSAAVAELAASLPVAFASEDYQARRRAIEEEFRASQDDAMQALLGRAAQQNIAILRTPLGFGMAPMHEGKAVRQDVFKQLPELMRREVEARIGMLEKELEGILSRAPLADKQRREHLAELAEDTARHAVEAALQGLGTAFGDLPPVAAFLAETEKDLIANAALFLSPAGGAVPIPPSGLLQDNRARRYLVNVLVSNGDDATGSPVVEEINPTAGALIGRAELAPAAQGPATDFLMIRPGALHRANGGVLMLDAHRVLASPPAWESLKRALKSGEIRLDPPPAETTGAPAMPTLEPDAIPLDVKIVLLGDRDLYTHLEQTDRDFAQLFKVQADFDETVARSDANITAYARLIASMVDAHGLKPVNAAGVARLIDEAARLAEDREKLSVEVGRVADIVREADYWAGTKNRSITTAEDVARAIEERVRRADRIRGQIQEDVERGIVLVDTAGTKAGQINGLSLVQAGGFSFGRTSRITARAHLGQGRVTDIEREVKLGGPLHSKGIMILWGYLAGRFAQDMPLQLAATLVFEQSYGAVEGDSASAAELFALLSALADIPLRQELAVTGSINQWGEVQAIGGVNEKIEGFFDVCLARGLTGTQGVIIPAANRQHLMLREDVVEAVQGGRFAVHGIKTADEGIALLTGLEAGQRGADGRYGAETVNGRVEAKLRGFAERGRGFAQKQGGANSA